MDILIPDNWLREYLKTLGTTKEIAKYLSLCGPSVEKVTDGEYGQVYSIEVTTNRIDEVGVYGIAREASAILPRFNVRASLRPLELNNAKFVKNVKYLKATVDHTLCLRFSAVLIRNVTLKDSPNWMKERLEAVGVRPINNVVDISNYIMHEIGQPVHTFDYDKIMGAKMILRESKKGETLTTLDGKAHKLPGGDIVIEDGQGRLIDLAGIMGGENSAVDANTKNVLLFVQTYNPINIRKTSMRLAHRTEAAVLFEKGLDPELVSIGIRRGIDLFIQLTGGKPENEILDLYPNPYKPKKVSMSLDFITERLGVTLSKGEISKFLNSLGFESRRKGKDLEVSIPSYRAADIEIPEDIVEEVARIYGYFNLPSELMTGKIPDPLPDAPFEFEQKLKNLLSGWGAVEIYTLSLVSKEETAYGLRLQNPLGADSEYLRTSLMPSLLKAIKENSGTKELIHLFEVANVYLPIKGNLPNEKITLAGIFSNTPYREAKGILESLLAKLNIDASFETEDSTGFLPSRRLSIKKNGKILGQFGILIQEGYLYYEFDIEAIRKESRKLATYKPISKYPPQIEDITLTFPEKTKIGEVIERIMNYESRITNVELKEIYKNAYTFRVWYQHPTKTLTDKEVEEIRNKIITTVKSKFGGIVKT